MSVSGIEPIRIVHFGLPGWTNALCDETIPQDTELLAAPGYPFPEWVDDRFTTDFEKATCPECVWRIRRQLRTFLPQPHVEPPRTEEIPPLDPPPASAYERALRWAEDIRAEPMDDERTIELAKVYATLAVADALREAENGMKELIGIWRGTDAPREG